MLLGTDGRQARGAFPVWLLRVSRVAISYFWDVNLISLVTNIKKDGGVPGRSCLPTSVTDSALDSPPTPAQPTLQGTS